MRHTTHTYFTRLLYPSIPYKNIEAVNSRLDNYGLIDKNISNRTNSKGTDVFGLTNQGHRKYNHNIVSAIMIGRMVDPVYGDKIALTHLIGDKMSDVIRNNIGVDRRDLFEAAMNYIINNKSKKFKVDRRRKYGKIDTNNIVKKFYGRY